jgi:hypothetical protein
VRIGEAEEVVEQAVGERGGWRRADAAQRLLRLLVVEQL